MTDQNDMRWGNTVQHVIRNVVTWFLRPRAPEKWIFFGGIAELAILNTADFYFKYQGPIGGRIASIEIETTGGIPDSIYWLLTILGALLVVGSVAWAWQRYASEQSRLSKKKVIVIEARGLRDDSGAPLETAVPTTIEGIRTSYVLDVRQSKDGIIIDPLDLLPPVQSMKTWLHQIQKNNDRADLTVVYGGLSAVPLTFLSGVLLDDESSIYVMDWDRNSEVWRSLDEADDNIRFSFDSLELLGSAPEVVLAVSVSYSVKAEDLATTFSCPIVRMVLPDLSSSHWSHTKQAALADQFLDVLKRLDARGVQQVHLVLAAQNSVVFNLGRRYDKRNLPKIAVYQFERTENTRYPWAIQMPVCGIQYPTIIHSKR